MVYSTSSYYAVKQKFGDAAYFFKRQTISAILGVVVMIFVSKVDYFNYIKGIGRKYKFRLLFLAYMVCIALQVYVLFFGEEVKGAKRWIKIPVLGSFQPSELTKICVILLVAYIVYAAPKRLDNVFGFIRVFLYVCPLLALVAAENLSTAIIIAGITFIVCFVVARKKGYFFIVGLIAVALVVGYIFLGEAFRGERIDAWLHVETHPKGYQILQGLYAIASGGILGKGLGNSLQKLGFIPESHNAMIFSVICEELGLVGAIAIILLYLLIVKNLQNANTRLNPAFTKNHIEGIVSENINLISPTKKLPTAEHSKKKISWSFFSNALYFFIISFIILYYYLCKHIQDN
jgi:cell division protein FtsW